MVVPEKKQRHLSVYPQWNVVILSCHLGDPPAYGRGWPTILAMPDRWVKPRKPRVPLKGLQLPCLQFLRTFELHVEQSFWLLASPKKYSHSLIFPETIPYLFEQDLRFQSSTSFQVLLMDLHQPKRCMILSINHSFIVSGQWVGSASIQRSSNLFPIWARTLLIVIDHRLMILECPYITHRIKWDWYIFHTFSTFTTKISTRYLDPMGYSLYQVGLQV